MKTNKNILLLIGFLLFVNSLMAQITKTEIAIEESVTHPSTSSYLYKARDGITLLPGFSYKADPGKYFSGTIEEDLIFDMNYSDALPRTDLTISKSLPVGSIAGSMAVAPSGAATYSIPIKIAPGTKGIQPNISVNYSSQSGNGVMGIGWNLSGISTITRASKTMVQDGEVKSVTLTSADRFALNGNRLAKTSGTYGADGAKYKTEMESFVTVISHNENSNEGPEWFEVKNSNGVTMEYGRGFNSCFTLDSKNIYWKVSKIIDHLGNYMTFHYRLEGRQHILEEIKYTGNANAGLATYNSIKFLYSTRTDKRILYTAGVKLDQKLILTSARNKQLINKEQVVHELDVLRI